MGNQGDQPRKGFHHWEGLRGQGEYYNPTLNINGKRTQFTDSAYIADLITDHAIGWMKKQRKDQPFFVYLSHKGVHAMFEPAKRHRGGGMPRKPFRFRHPITLLPRTSTRSTAYPSGLKNSDTAGTV